MDIQFTDLKALHQPIMPELENTIKDVMHSAQFIQGELVHKFESSLSKYMDDIYVQTCGNGTDAISIALRALGIKNRDKIMVPSFSYFASAEAVSSIGAQVVFYDIDEVGFNVSLNSIKKTYTNDIKAVLVTNLYGLPSDLINIKSFCDEHNIFMIEDNAQALGARIQDNNGLFHKAGTVGHVSTTSFFPTKSLGGFGDGGAIFSRSKAIIDQCKVIAQHGQTAKHEHKLIGVNSRLDALQAAILNIKLPYLDKWNSMRNTVAKLYQTYLPSFIQIPDIEKDKTHVFHLYTVLFDEQNQRDGYSKKLSAHGIPNYLYYPKLIHEQEAYARQNTIELNNSIYKHKRMLTLPMHPYRLWL